MRAEYICPVLTMFRRDGSIDMGAMKIIFDRLIDGGIDGIVIMGSSGEFYGMNMDDAKRFAADSIEYLKGRIPVYIGTSRMIAEETVELSSCAIEFGADAVMILSPYYIASCDKGVEAYYDNVIGKIRGDIIMYNFPACTGHDINAETILNLLKSHNNIIGIKDTVVAPSHTMELIRKVKSVYSDFRIYSGYDDNFAHIVGCGGNGCIAALPNLIPDICSQWAEAFNVGDLSRVVAIQKIIDEFMQFYSISVPFMPAMKYAMLKMGLPVSTMCKFPAVDIDYNQKQQIVALMKKHELI